MGYGFWNFIRLDLFYIILFGPIIAIFLLNKIMQFSLQLFYQGLNIKKHTHFVTEFWKKNHEPSVDIFLPWAGENLSMHEQVVKACAQINYKNYKIYMLDDVGSENHRELAQKYGAIYLSRPNKGQYKKSGNLEYGYRHSTGKFVLILDADFIPIKDILKDLVPYAVVNKKIGILQTPQFFDQTNNIHKKSKIEFGGGNIVEEFYKIVMPSRDEFKAAMCVGTSALYRKEVIKLLNGTPKVHASEDLATGLLITQYGYHVKYLPLVVSMGKSPDTFQGYFKQHMRWCSGNLVFARYWPTARLNVLGRLVYATNPLHYITEALSVIFSFQLLFLLYFHADSLSLWHTLYFLPYIILSRFLIPLTKTNKNKVGTRLAAMNNSYTYFYTYIRMIIKGVPSWQPTGVKTSSLNADFLNAFHIGILMSSVFIISFIFVIISRFSVFGNFNTYIVLAWSFYSVFWHAIYLSSVGKYIKPLQIAETKNSFKKTFIHAKAYSTTYLFIILIVLSIPHATIALANPSAPTMAAIHTTFSGSAENIEHVATAPKDAIPQKNILGAQVQAREKKTYKLTVEKGDTLRKLSEKAIQHHIEIKDLIISEYQVNSAANILAQNVSQPRNPQPGMIIEFDEELVSDSISTTLSSTEN